MAFVLGEQREEKLSDGDAPGQHQGLIPVVAVEVILGNQMRIQEGDVLVTATGHMEKGLTPLGVVLLQEVDLPGLQDALVHGQEKRNLPFGPHGNSSQMDGNHSEDTAGG